MLSGMNKRVLSALIARGYTQRQIAEREGTSQTNVGYWLRKHGLQTKATQHVPANGTMRTCEQCGRRWVYKTHQGTTVRRCNSCCTNDQRVGKRLKALAFLGGKCARCGYDRCSASLHFHHKDPGQKEFEIARNINRRWESLKAELEKCVLLCANCHGEEHHEHTETCSSVE